MILGLQINQLLSKYTTHVKPVHLTCIQLGKVSWCLYDLQKSLHVGSFAKVSIRIFQYLYQSSATSANLFSIGSGTKEFCPTGTPLHGHRAAFLGITDYLRQEKDPGEAKAAAAAADT